MIEEWVVALTMEDKVGFCKALNWLFQPRRPSRRLTWADRQHKRGARDGARLARSGCDDRTKPEAEEAAITSNKATKRRR